MLNLGPEPRILITRLSAIGDCIHTLPLLCALRSHYPNAFIAWATQSAPASLIQGHHALNAVIEVDRRWIKSWRSIRSIARQLRAHRFDVVIDPQSLTKSSLLGWLSGAPCRIGFAWGQGREVSPVLNTVRVVPRHEHVVERYLELLGPLGIDHPTVRFDLPTRAEAVLTVEQFLAQSTIAQNEFALLNPGAGWNSKRWPHQRYAEVARHLSREHGVSSIVLWSGTQEHRWAEEIVTASGRCATLAPNTSLAELADFCRRAALFVGSDTGPMHLAAAVGTACVAMFGPTRIDVCGPYGPRHQSLQAYHQGGGSNRRRGEDNSAMRAISVESVCAACDHIVGTRSGKVA